MWKIRKKYVLIKNNTDDDFHKIIPFFNHFSGFSLIFFRNIIFVYRIISRCWENSRQGMRKWGGLNFIIHIRNLETVWAWGYVVVIIIM